jgi:hypothetical protein
VLQKCSRLEGRSAIQDRSCNLSSRGGSSGAVALAKSKPINYTLSTLRHTCLALRRAPAYCLTAAAAACSNRVQIIHGVAFTSFETYTFTP